jgi:hypothetical protein
MYTFLIIADFDSAALVKLRLAARHCGFRITANGISISRVDFFW